MFEVDRRKIPKWYRVTQSVQVHLNTSPSCHTRSRSQSLLLQTEWNIVLSDSRSKWRLWRHCWCSGWNMLKYPLLWLNIYVSPFAFQHPMGASESLVARGRNARHGIASASMPSKDWNEPLIQTTNYNMYTIYIIYIHIDQYDQLFIFSYWSWWFTFLDIFPVLRLSRVPRFSDHWQNRRELHIWMPGLVEGALLWPGQRRTKKICSTSNMPWYNDKYSIKSPNWICSPSKWPKCHKNGGY